MRARSTASSNHSHMEVAVTSVELNLSCNGRAVAPALRYRAARRYVEAAARTATRADISTRAIARALKTPGCGVYRAALARAVAELAPLVPVGAQLVPVPRASGCVGGMLWLALGLAAVVPSASVVVAITRERPVPSSHRRRRSGGDGLTPAEHASSFVCSVELDPRRPVVLVDNVVVSGATATGAALVLGRPDAIALAFAAGEPIAAVACRRAMRAHAA